MAEGLLNWALDPEPSLAPGVPSPAKVVTRPADVILRIQLFSVSATYTIPELSTAVAEGL